jgi:hypothetical protein
MALVLAGNKSLFAAHPGFLDFTHSGDIEPKKLIIQLIRSSSN